MHTACINKVTKEILQENNTTFIDVGFDVLLDGEVVQSRRHGYSLDTTQEEIEVDIKKYVETFADDAARAEANKKVEELQHKADEIITNLTGKEL